jgi:hypothetical protein
VDVARELAGLESAAKAATIDAARLTALLRNAPGDVERLLHQTMPQARQMLRKVLVSRLRCEAEVYWIDLK